jgi:hypothetical protein
VQDTKCIALQCIVNTGDDNTVQVSEQCERVC